MPARTREGDGCAVGRRRRRELRRLSPLSLARERRTVALATPVGPPRAAVRSCGARLSEAGLGAEGAAGEVDAPVARARFGARLFPQRLDAARRHAAPALQRPVPAGA